MDSIAGYECEAFLIKFSHDLAELYTSALDLPVVEPDTTGVEETAFAPQQCSELCDSLKLKIFPFDAYWKTFDSTVNESPVQCSLSGDISEIYFDLKDNLGAEIGATPTGDFLWDYDFRFGLIGVGTFWGRWRQFRTGI